MSDDPNEKIYKTVGFNQIQQILKSDWNKACEEAGVPPLFPEVIYGEFDDKGV